MKDILIVGLGEIGASVQEVEEKANNQVWVKERDWEDQNFDCRYDVVHICIPCTDPDVFIKSVSVVIDEVDFDIMIIHSTVPVGTTRKIISYIGFNAPIVHSFVRGIHPNLAEGILTFEKPVGDSSRKIS